MRINRRQIVVYPFLFAIYPLLNLYVTNFQRLPFTTVAKTLLLIFGATLVLYLTANWLLKASTSAGILTTAIAVAVLYYGVFYDVVGVVGTIGATVQRHQYLFLLPAWVFLFVLIGTLAVRKRVKSAQVNAYLNFLSAAIIGVVLVQRVMSYVPSIIHNPSSARASSVRDDSRFVPTQGRSLCARIELDALPDVYYIILDAYGRADVLRKYYDFDNSAFLDSLASKGFYIASESRSNYPQTAMSLPSSLNVDYLDALGILDDGLSVEERFFKSFFLVRETESYVARQFSDSGYTTISFRSKDPLVNDEFSTRFFSTTIGRALLPSYNMRIRRQNLMTIFDGLKRVPQIEAPTFTFAHILAPHPPFVFDREGNFTGVTGYRPSNCWLPQQAYTDQLLFINRMTEDVVDTILAQSETPPIIIIQADHGPVSSWWRSEETLPILNAYYLPDGGEQYLYPSITPVNTFRLILDLYFGTDLGLLEERSYMVGDLSAYELLCESDCIFPDDSDPEIWAASATKVLEENDYHLPIEDICDIEKFFLMNEGFFQVGGTPGRYFRWAGPSLDLQFPVEANQDYVFRAQVIHHLSDESQEVRLIIDDELVDSTNVPSGPLHEIELIVPAERIHTEPFVRVRIEHGYSGIAGTDPRERSLAYFWIEWAPLSEARVRVSQAGPENCPLVTVVPSLKGTIGIDPQLQTPPWPIEVYDDGSLLWLGHGDQQGVKGTLWSAEKQIVYLTFDVAPGPAREDSLRTVELTVENEAGIKTERQQFNQPTTLIFAVELQPGRNEFSFKSLDKATILTQPNGDTRPLLVRLRHITVASLLDRSQAGPENYPLITVDSSLARAVGIDPHLKTPWPIEVYEEHSLSFLWLGHGEAEDIAGTLWSDAARQVILEFEVSPGPSREDQQRTVQLVMQSNNQVAAQKETFGEQVVLAFPVQLQPGRNDFRFTVLDEATTSVHGDTRPLLVSLHHITVKPLPGP